MTPLRSRLPFALALSFAAAAAVLIVACAGPPGESESLPSPTPEAATSPAANIPALGFVFVAAGPSRAETLREVERQTGVRLSIPWLPDGMEVTGVRVNVGLEPSRIVTAEISVGGQGKGFGMDQTDRHGVLLGGHDLPVHPPASRSVAAMHSSQHGNSHRTRPAGPSPIRPTTRWTTPPSSASSSAWPAAPPELLRTGN